MQKYLINTTDNEIILKLNPEAQFKGKCLDRWITNEIKYYWVKSWKLHQEFKRPV